MIRVYIYVHLCYISIILNERSNTMNELTPERLMNDMIDWLVECYPEDVDQISELNDQDIKWSVSRLYDGGVNQFIVDSKYTNTI